MVNLAFHRYWFEFECSPGIDWPPGIGYGCGVTAMDYEDAVGLVSTHVFRGEPMFPIKKCIEDVDVSTLDGGQILPNMASPHRRGIWYPLGYQD